MFTGCIVKLKLFKIKMLSQMAKLHTNYLIQICKNAHLMGSHYVYRVYRKTKII